MSMNNASGLEVYEIWEHMSRDHDHVLVIDHRLGTFILEKASASPLVTFTCILRTAITSNLCIGHLEAHKAMHHAQRSFKTGILRHFVKFRDAISPYIF